MKRLVNACHSLVKASSPRRAREHDGPHSEISLSLYVSSVVYRLACRIERLLVRLSRARRDPRSARLAA